MIKIASISTFNSSATPITTATTGDALPTLPAPSTDPITAMMSSGDFGSAVAAMAFSNEKNIRDAARTARDAAYNALESTEKHELTEMKASSDDKLVTGIASGALELGGAGATFGSAWTDRGSAWSTRLSGGAEGAKAGATLLGAVGKSTSDAHDRAITRDQQSCDELKRVGENHNDDVEDAGKAMDKAVQFYQDWIGARSAEQAAALHRS